MSSIRRTIASRRNGRLSHGPITPEGKRNSSQNAISHGLVADCVALSGESREGFEALVNQHIEKFGPIDAVESGMIEEMAASCWRLRRAWAIENTILEEGIAARPTGAGDLTRITGSFRQMATSPELALLHRYETRLHLMYQRAFHNILLLRTLGTRNEPSPISGHLVESEELPAAVVDPAAGASVPPTAESAEAESPLATTTPPPATTPVPALPVIGRSETGDPAPSLLKCSGNRASPPLPTMEPS